MAFIQIRKKSENAWKHITDVKIQEFMISEFYFKLDNGIFQIVEVGGAQRVPYQLSQITVYDDTSGGAPETFTTDVALYERLLALKYTGFKEGSGGGGSNLTLEQARENGNLIFGNILGSTQFDKTGLPNAVAQVKDITDATDGLYPLIGNTDANPVTGDLYIKGSIVSQTSTTAAGVTTTKEYDVDSMGTYAREEVSGGASDVVRQVETDIYNGFGHIIENGSDTKSIIVSAELGVAADHYIDKEGDPNAYIQLKDVLVDITIIPDATVGILPTNQVKYYAFTTADTMASLPTIADYSGKTLYLANKSNGAIKIFSNDAVSNDISDNRVRTNELTITEGAVILFNDGVNWQVMARSSNNVGSKVIISDSNVGSLVKTQGVAGSVLLKSYVIPANTMPSDCVLRISLIMTKLGDNESFSTSFGVGLSPAIPIHSITSGAVTNNMVGISRVVRVSNNRIYGINNSGGFFTDYVSKQANLVDTVFNTAGAITLNLRVSTTAGLDEVRLQSLVVEVLPQK